MELRHIRYFLMVAEEKNFTRAAARLGIGQPPLSMQIRDLEQEIGYPLFHRGGQGSELTEAGQAFLLQVRQMPEIAGEAIAAARRAARGDSGLLRLGFTGTVGFNPRVPAAIRAFQLAWPAVELTMTEANSLQLVERLQKRQLDLALIRAENAGSDRIGCRLLLQEPLVAVLPAGHRQARARGRLDLACLQDDKFIFTPQDAGISLREAAIQGCLAAGFAPQAGHTAPHIVSILSVVAAGLGVSLVPESLRQLALRGVVFKPLKPPAPVTGLAAAWHREAFSAPVRNFLDLIDAGRPLSD